MKKITNNKKSYNFVNEKTVDGVLYTLYRRPNKDCRKTITVKGVKYIAVNPDVKDKFILVSDGKKKTVKGDVNEVWSKLTNIK